MDGGGEEVAVTEDADYRTITRVRSLDRPHVLAPGETILGITRERVRLPPDVAGWLEVRSRFARLGLMIHVTSGFMAPGVDNRQVLEMSNVARHPLLTPRRRAPVSDRPAALRRQRDLRRALRASGSPVISSPASPPGFWELLGFRIEHADEHGAVLTMEVPDAMMSPFGTVHGGAIATLFDTGLAIAIARRLEPEDRIATHNLIRHLPWRSHANGRYPAPVARGEPPAHRRRRRRRRGLGGRYAGGKGARHLRRAATAAALLGPPTARSARCRTPEHFLHGGGLLRAAPSARQAIPIQISSQTQPARPSHPLKTVVWLSIIVQISATDM